MNIARHFRAQGEGWQEMKEGGSREVTDLVEPRLGDVPKYSRTQIWGMKPRASFVHTPLVQYQQNIQ